MNRNLRNTLLFITAIAAGMFVIAPGEVDRDNPPTPVSVYTDEPGKLVLDLNDNISDEEITALEGLLGSSISWTYEDARIGIVPVESLSTATFWLDGFPNVVAAEPQGQYTALGFPNDPMYGKQWHLRAMGAPEGWEHSPQGEGVIVAVVDTGITQIEDLKGTKFVEGKSFVPGASTPADGNGHGTHVTGTIAQTTNNGIGCAGIAPRASIMPVKVLSDSGSGSFDWVAAGILWAGDNGAQVINLSLGGPYSKVVHQAIKDVRAKGVIVVAAAGNDGREGVGYPGALAETIGVSATGPDGTLAPYSSWGKGVDIAAPGGDKKQPGGGVWQGTIDGKGGSTYAEYQGTSMATPHVVGAAAVLLSTGECDSTCVQETLLRTAGDGKWDPKFGYGKLDLGAALGAMTTTYSFTKFGLAVLIAFLISSLEKANIKFGIASALTAGFAAAGFFFLEYLPLGNHWILDLLTSGILTWPSLVFGDWFTGNPLLASALLPGAATFVLGAFQRTRWLAVGITCGIGTHLLHAASTGSIHPWFMPGLIGTAWLLLNSLGCLIFALAMAGAEKLDNQPRGN